MINDWIIPFVAAFVSTLGFAIIYNIHGKNLIIASLCGAFGWVFYLIAARFTASAIVPYFIAGIVVALYSEVAAKIFKTPVTVYLMPGFIPLVPGGTIFRTMEACLFGNITVFAEGLVNTLKIGGAISLGLILMSSFFRLLRTATVQIKTKE